VTKAYRPHGINCPSIEYQQSKLDNTLRDICSTCSRSSFCRTILSLRSIDPAVISVCGRTIAR